MKRSRQVLVVISSIVLVVAAVIVASTAYPLGQREITKTTIETVLKTETQSTTITEIPTEEPKTVTNYSTEYIQTTILTTDIKTTTVTRTTRELITRIREPWKSAAFAVFLSLPREARELGYIQHTENFSLGYNVNPSGIDWVWTDEWGNNYSVIYWNDKPEDRIMVSFEAIVFRTVNQKIISETSPHPYPIPENLIPEEIKQYLKPPTYHEVDYNNPDIIALAEELTKGSNEEAEVVYETISWISHNIQYDYGFEILHQHPGRWGPTETLKYKAGQCEQISDLTILLLLRQGIPTRKTFHAHHAWIQVYYPKIGWINYDPTWWTDQNPQIFLPYHVELGVVFCEGIAKGSAFKTLQWERDIWNSERIGGNRIKVTRTLVFAPKTS